MDTAFKKRHGWLRDGNGFISLKAILKYRHGSFPQSKLSRELAPASRNHEVPWIISMRSQAVSLKAADFRAQKIICGNLCQSVVNPSHADASGCAFTAFLVGWAMKMRLDLCKIM